MVSAYDSTPAGLKALNDFLESRSFLEGFSVSQVDTFVFNKIAANVDAEKYPNVVRWYRHIASYGADMLSFPGEAPVGESKDAAAEKPAASKGDDSDSDSDDDSDDDFEIPESSDEDSDVNLDEIARKRKAERQAREAEKMAKAKSIIVLDIKPYDAETDMEDMAKQVKAIEMDGLTWGAYKLVPVAFGVKKLQISVVVVDSKVSTDVLEEKIMEIPGDIVQSVDIQSFNKL